MTARSTKDRPIRSGQTITYNYRFLNALTGLPINVTGYTITYNIKSRGAALSSGSGAIVLGTNGDVTADIIFTLDNDDTEEAEAVNVQFFATPPSGPMIPGVPLIEYVALNVPGLADASRKMLSR